MAGGLPEPILISELVHLDHITIAGQTVEFRHVFYTWMAMLILFVVGWLVRRNISLIPGKMQNIFESIIGGLEDFTVTNMGEDGRKAVSYTHLDVYKRQAPRCAQGGWSLSACP